MKVRANGKIYTFPDGTSPDEIRVSLEEYFSAQGLSVASETVSYEDRPATPAQFDQMMGDVGTKATSLMSGQEVFSPETSGVPGGTMEEQEFAAQAEIPILDVQGRPIMPPPAEPQMEPSLQEKLIGAAEVLTTLASGATFGAGGMVRGTLEGLTEQILSGEFGTPEAAQMIQQKAMGRAGEATYMPRTQVGQEYVQETADVLSQLPAMAPLAAEAGAIRAGLAGAAQAARAGGRPAVQQMAGQMVRETGREAMDVMVPPPVRQAVQQGIIKPVAAAATRTMEPVRRAGEAVSASIDARQQRKTQGVRDLLKGQPDNAEVVEFRLVNDRVVSDNLASSALKQGWDSAVLGSIKASSNLDKNQMQKMLNIFKIGKKRAAFAAKTRPSGVLGDSMMSRVNFLMKIKSSSGKQIDDIAKTQLRGNPVNFDQPMSTFINDLADIGVAVERGPNGKFKVNLKGSDIEGDAAGATLLNRVLERLGDTNVPDAYGVHTAKRYIDTQVDYGKRRANPLTQQAERVVKKLRRNLNTALGDEFPQYREANTKFSESLQALEDIQDAVGKKVNFESDRAGEAFGTALRKVLSNYASRNTIIDSIDRVETIAKKYGLKIKDDLMTQIIFVNEIDRMFGAVAKGSLKGVFEQGLRKGSDFARSSAAEKAVMLVGRAGEAVRGINEENAIKAIEEILRRQAQEPTGTEVAE
tara:strand:+ start:2631 stop:4721 length:2091 start_codon:yes stop_codon:yes gene_type:complete